MLSTILARTHAQTHEISVQILSGYALNSHTSLALGKTEIVDCVSGHIRFVPANNAGMTLLPTKASHVVEDEPVNIGVRKYDNALTHLIQKACNQPGFQCETRTETHRNQMRKLRPSTSLLATSLWEAQAWWHH